MESALIDSAAPKKAQADAIGVECLGCKACARRYWYPSADNRRLSEDAHTLVGQVHRAPAPLANSGLLAHELCHQRIEPCALSNRVSMRAMRACHGIVIAQGQTGSDDRCLLANTGVIGAGNLACHE